MRQLFNPCMLLLAMGWCATSTAQNYVCASDLDGDGNANRAEEQAVCIESPVGRVCPLEAQQCVAGPLGLGVCPIDARLPCVDTPAGTMMCSRHACMDPATIPRDVTDPPDGNVGNDGPRDAAGACMGQLVIFPGRALRCREAGTQTAYHNCCSDAGAMDDTMGAQNEQSQSEEVQSQVDPLYDVITNQCDGEDKEASFRRQSDYCYDLGDYCAEDWFVGCVQRARMQCCFNSKLARIIHEQGRSQLNTFPTPNSFGTAEEPYCRGFTIEEFQSLDFSKIDLSEYAAELRTRSQGIIQQELRNNATQRTGN